jgi:DNA-binding PadR family transcriptional regulator
VRPRDRVMSHLRAVGEVRDPGGLASTALAEAIGYPGSSVAFAQLLSAMERSGLIEREIRGRRTYRIGLAGAAFDYDELARWLLPSREPGSESVQTGALVQTVASLERKLANVESRQRRLRAENTRLRELLTVARQSLAEQQRIAASQEPDAYLGRLDTGAAVQLLERLLSSLRGGVVGERRLAEPSTGHTGTGPVVVAR